LRFNALKLFSAGDPLQIATYIRILYSQMFAKWTQSGTAYSLYFRDY